MKIKGSMALVTGANRGLGRAYAAELVSRGAAKVYGAARDPAAEHVPRVRPGAGGQRRPRDREHALGHQLLHQPARRLLRRVQGRGLVAFDAVEAGQVEVLADQRSQTVKAELSRDHELIYPPVQEFWDAAIKGTSS